MTKLKQYTRAEIENSDVKKNTFIIIHDKVYDVHQFLNEHPGGEEILLDHRNKDASEDFDDVGHSTDAFELMNKYRVGELIESDRANSKPKAGWVAGYNSKEPESYVSGPGAPFYLLIIGIIGIVIAIMYLNA
ncbi:cytochrome b5-like [Leptopilina heterotoma]|uniref:cytochrome b5-like n=1 Tax=Leptopilina heterotoma TaxID=63436 RepID=UPI001CA7D16F|nr:cytochrome b5-like [Leptopilina heterotoma]XP_043481077.1 cytochrome b5-like [Leptopilina heterotoma]